MKLWLKFIGLIMLIMWSTFLLIWEIYRVVMYECYASIIGIVILIVVIISLIDKALELYFSKFKNKKKGRIE